MVLLYILIVILVLDKTVKLWKVYDKELKKVASMNVSRDDTTHLITKKPKSRILLLVFTFYASCRFAYAFFDIL